MREESHLNDMRAAIRGDFERLEERRGEQELMRIEPDAPENPEPPEAAQQPEPELNAESRPLEVEVAPPPEDVLENAPATEPEPRGGAAQKLLDRLLGR